MIQVNRFRERWRGINVLNVAEQKTAGEYHGDQLAHALPSMSYPSDEAHNKKQNALSAGAYQERTFGRLWVGPR
ncbi:MAG: hypothetical protein JO193_09595 [Candidatus Eremiobacteraeota bacterium]|nr:hypothetical protein [Candidatus Eremiobacteraeota bacterium]